MGLFNLDRRGDREGVYYAVGTFDNARVQITIHKRPFDCKVRLADFEKDVMNGHKCT